MDKRRILVIAGSDSSGGAGIEADQKVIAAHGCYAMTATTALTAQNTTGVFDVRETPPDFVKKQIVACIEDIGVDVVKTGMLASAETIKVVASLIRQYKVEAVVIDPVMISTTGSELLPSGAVVTLCEDLIPLATILTPNVPESKAILRYDGKVFKDPETVDDLLSMAKAVQSLGPKYVLLKGGHVPFDKDEKVALLEEDKHLVVDVLYGNGEVVLFKAPYQRTRNTHGTGCSLASAIASNLALGFSVRDAVLSGCRYIEAAIRTASNLGLGNGPINHFHSTYSLPFAPGRFIDWLLERQDVRSAWEAHTQHDFVSGLADGSLPVANFKYYLIQDYLYLVQFARANALAAYKAKKIDDIAAASRVVQHIHHEMNLHIEYCKGFGLSKEEMESAEENEACTAYTRYVLDIGLSEDWVALQMSMAPCLLGYGAIARRLYDDPRTKTKSEGNIYWNWIENYIADDYVQAVKAGSELLERHAVLQSPHRIEELVKIFIHATNMETGFWDMGVEGDTKRVK